MRKPTGGIPPKDIDTYLLDVSEPAKSTLAYIREIIRDTAPLAEEAISYQIPVYKYLGMLVGFGAFDKHCGFYVMSPALMESMKDELQGYKTATGTIRFPHDEALPEALIRKIVRARMAENEASHAEKKMKKAK